MEFERGALMRRLGVARRGVLCRMLELRGLERREGDDIERRLDGADRRTPDERRAGAERPAEDRPTFERPELLRLACAMPSVVAASRNTSPSSTLNQGREIRANIGNTPFLARPSAPQPNSSSYVNSSD
jgi:hypothetical protein